MSNALCKQSFLALSALAWVDGSVRPREREGLLGAAKKAGLSEAECAEISAALEKETKLDSFVPGDMTTWQRVLTFGLGVWLARLDGVQSADESELLRDLAKRLDLDKGTQERAAAAANDVFCLPEGGRPDRFDFTTLDARLREKLPQLVGK